MVTIKDINFEVEITKKRIKNIILKVQDNKIIASCPYYIPKYEVYKFIESKRDWIYAAYVYQKHNNKNKYLYKGGDVFYIYGKQYKLIFSVGKSNVSILEDTIYLTYKQEGENAIKYLYKYLDSKLLIKAKEYLDKHRFLLLDYGYNLEPVLKARAMTSRWGVCYIKKNSINISSYLIHYPLDCLEYIVVHEIVHFIIPNHSKRFYEIVLNNMPNYKEAENKLK